MSRSEEEDVPATVEECLKNVRIASRKKEKKSFSNVQEGVSKKENSNNATNADSQNVPSETNHSAHLDTLTHQLTSSSQYVVHSQGAECLEPFKYICTLPGKNIRSQLIDAFQLWLKIPVKNISEIKEIVGFLHNASLLIDDIEDGSKLRRGKPVAHSIFGIPNTLNCGNYVYFLALEKCLQMKSQEAVNVMTTELLNLHRGQGRELVWRENFTCPTLGEYTSMILDKTGGLFRLAIGLMLCFSDTFHSVSGKEIKDWKDKMARLVNLLSVYFQIRDDYINLASTKYHKKKTFCEDLTEGKFSFPIVHSILCSQSQSQKNSKLMSILRQRTEDRDLKLCAVEIMRSETQSFKYTKAYLGEVRDKIYAEIETLGGHEHLLALMKLLEKEVEECD
uniref:Geranylgeranyl pyrophosphate synthase n=1 Tax=Aplanochytrium stocchinoi TaxID=215587 RepID=A0A7S3PN45_9STRA